MRTKDLRIPLLICPTYLQDGVLPNEPSHIATWRSREPSTSSAGPSRRVALAYSDNTVWIATVPEAPLSAPQSLVSPTSDKLPQIVIPTSRTSTSASGSRTPTGSRLSRPSIPRASSFAGRHRASSSASSILSSTSRRRSSALSPPPFAQPVASITTETASSDPGHDHRTSVSDKAELRDHLREQRARTQQTQDDSRLGLGISGLGRRGLPGVHSKEEIADASGAASPRSTRSTESGRTISTRLMGWMGGEEGQGEKERKDLMERVQEVEVEREMAKEVAEDQREIEDEETIDKARRTPVGTPRQDDSGLKTRLRTRRIVLPKPWKGKISRIQVDEASEVLLILRDVGILDIISLVTPESVDSIDLELPEPRPGTVPSPKATPHLSPFWYWNGLQVTRYKSKPLLVVSGLPWPCALPSPNGEVTRTIMLRQVTGAGWKVVSRLELPGQGDVAVYQSEAETFLLHSTPLALTRYPITSPISIPSMAPMSSARTGLQPRSVSAASPNSSSPPARSTTPGPGGSLTAPSQVRKIRSSVHLRDGADQPLIKSEQKDRETSLTKFLAHRKADKDTKGKPADVVFEWGVGEAKELDRRGAVPWRRIIVVDSGMVFGIGMKGGVDVMELTDTSVQVLGRLDLPPGESASDVYSLSHVGVILVVTEIGTSVYMRPSAASGGSQQWRRIERYQTVGVACPASDTSLLIAKEEGLELVQSSESDRQCVSERVIPFYPVPSKSEIDCIVPYDADTCFVADSTGQVSKRRLQDILAGRCLGDADGEVSSDRSESRVTYLKVVQSDPPYLVAGDEDGVIRIWNAETFDLQGSWTLFAYPVSSVTLLNMPQAGSLAGTLLCTSQAGTIGLISLVEMEQMFLIPASRVPLRRIFVGGKDILLAYANGKARVWNYETQEFRRSTGLDAAEDMLGSGDWAEILLDANSVERKPLESITSGMPVQSEAGRTLTLDVSELCSFVQSSRSSMTSSPLSTLRTVLSALIPFGSDEEVDRIATSELGMEIPRDTVVRGLTGPHQSVALPRGSAADTWQLSPSMTGTVQIALVALLRPFLDSPDYEHGAAKLIAYFTASLPDCSILPDLVFFAAYYLDPIPNIHQAARMLFGCRMDAMTEQEIEVTVDAHLPELPTFVPTADRHLEIADLALTMLGGMAIHKYQLMPPNALKAIAESVLIYLESTQPIHLSLAIELASKGFDTWQAFVDPAEMLRRLFYLSTHTPASQGSQASQIAAQARLAVLHVASSNPALFMSTLSMDILDAKSVEGRKSIMKLCVYIARKRPQVLENSLPKVVEAVVKSLDPNVGKMREDVQQTATVILNELVLAFSTVDFHSATQKLAVGTHEGALIMYDLKTASRLYILEPHRHPVSAVNFSPDGRRLITVSLEEGNLTVWKIGSSLSGFFNVGGPPRQGGDKGEPFKRIEFARADNVPLDSMSALSDVQITWPGARQAKVVIKETAMTFET